MRPPGGAYRARREHDGSRRSADHRWDALEKRERDPSAGFVQLTIARLSEAMIIARNMILGGDLQAMDRMIKLTGELGRYHGFAPPRRPAPPRNLARDAVGARRRAREIFLLAKA